jgi:propanediol dehydratase small subunit
MQALVDDAIGRHDAAVGFQLGAELNQVLEEAVAETPRPLRAVRQGGFHSATGA